MLFLFQNLQHLFDAGFHQGGLVLAFRASIVLGIICFFISPAYLIFGLVKWFAGVDLAQLIVERFKEV